MKSLKPALAVALVIATLWGLARIIVVERQPSAGTAPGAGIREPNLPQRGQLELPRVSAAPKSKPPRAPRTDSPPVVGRDQQTPRGASPNTAPAEQTNTLAANTSSTAPVPVVGEPLVDPLARAALAFVGMDAEAEAYWYDAINDPALSAHERQDLIEDLNEDGISDPKHPTPDDLPLIVNRMMIIEQVAWDAMDEVNADAFVEAYKDLVNLADVALGGGEPVR